MMETANHKAEFKAKWFKQGLMKNMTVVCVYIEGEFRCSVFKKALLIRL